MFAHRYKYWFAALLGVYSFLNIYLLDGDRLFAASIDAIPLLAIILVLSISVWGINLLVEKWVSKQTFSFHPLIIQFLVSAVSVLALSFVSSQVTGLIWDGPFDFSWQNFLLSSSFTSRINLFLNCLNAIFFFSKKLKEKAVEAERLKTLNSEARLESINSQLNPHFFFNNLSALSVLIHEDVDQADRYLQKLSEIYRYILRNKSNELIPVDEEMDFLKSYLELLSIRFGESLTFSFSQKNSLSGKFIPPAVLQLLVENVVKHNYFTRKEPLEIQLICTEDYLRISNKKQLKKAVEESSGIGLQNISERYRFLDKTIRILDEPDYFLVELPLIDDKELTPNRRRASGPSQDHFDYSEAPAGLGHR